MIRRLETEMTLHYPQILRFGQWWNRSRRAGHAFAEGTTCTASRLTGTG